MKFYITLLFICLSNLSFSQITYYINDNFESYSPNTFPSSGGWILQWNGAGNQYQIVSNSQHYSGSNAMQLRGQNNWSACMYKSVTTSPIIYVECWVLSPTSYTGISYDDLWIRFDNLTQGTWGTLYAACGLSFETGYIFCSIGDNGTQPQLVQPFSANTWYKLKLKLDRIHQTIDFWVNDELKVNSLYGIISSVGYTCCNLQASYGGTYCYFDDIKVWSETSGINHISNTTPDKFSLSQNYPNPFNPTTVIRFSLPVVSQASLKVYDVLGKEVTTLVNEKLSSGTYSVDWNASSFPSGVYFYKLQTDSYTETKRMILIK